MRCHIFYKNQLTSNFILFNNSIHFLGKFNIFNLKIKQHNTLKKINSYLKEFYK